MELLLTHAGFQIGLGLPAQQWISNSSKERPQLVRDPGNRLTLNADSQCPETHTSCRRTGQDLLTTMCRRPQQYNPEMSMDLDY